MHHRYYKNIKLSAGCLNLTLSPIQIELKLKKPNSSLIQLLKMIVQASSNLELRFGLSQPPKLYP